jgi:hydroxyacylglutathione hydrolase
MPEPATATGSGRSVVLQRPHRLHAAGAVTVVDIRNPGELAVGVIPGALSIPLAQLRSRLHEIPQDQPIVLHCAGGWRSSVAASLLRAEGFGHATDLVGGYNAWAGAQAWSPIADRAG